MMTVGTIGVPKPSKKYATKRPTRDEFVLEELANQLAEAKQEDAEVLLTVWGWEEQVRGLITEMDSRTGKVHIQRHGIITKVSFMDIMKIESPGG
ncbi:YolD-like family protein [Paenibacillus sp. TAB 01]|uniref:YolD-like family protein n=1 Tax=Paenibacillus sp. TAB 01 TaxID=3368988 RepID=UPI0037503C37